jgi:hypothetical protein
MTGSNIFEVGTYRQEFTVVSKKLTRFPRASIRVEWRAAVEIAASMGKLKTSALQD